MAVTTAAIGTWMAANAGTLAAVSAAASVASTAYSGISQMQQANAQAKYQEEQNKSLAVQAAQSYDDLSPAEIDLQRNAAEQALQNQSEELQAKGRVNVFAAASGVGGGSVDSMLYDIEAIGGRNMNEILRQREAGLYSIKQQAEQARYGAMGAQSSQAISRPSWLEVGIATGTQAIKGFDKYMQQDKETFSQQKPAKAKVKGGV